MAEEAKEDCKGETEEKREDDDEGEEDDDLRCCVCGYHNSFDENDIVACSGCPVAVHQRCYGIRDSVVRGDWFCQACTFDVPPTARLECQLCNARGCASAIAVTTDRKWVHGHCSSWLLKMDPNDSEKMDLTVTPVTEMCDVCAPERCTPCIICKQPTKVQRCGEPMCRNHFHPWCMSHHSGKPEQMVYWGHYMRTSDRETLLPYAYCFEHKGQVPHDTREDVCWHLPNKQITKTRRATEVSEEMAKLSAIAAGIKALNLSSSTAPGFAGDAAHAAALELCNNALSSARGLRFSRPLTPTMQVVTRISKRLDSPLAKPGRDQRVHVAHVLLQSLVETEFLAASWLLQLRAPHEYPFGVERRAREMAAHLHALRALCRGLMEKARAEPDPTPPRSRNNNLDDNLDESKTPQESLDSSASSRSRKRTRMDAETRRQNRLLGVKGRDELVRAGQKCVMCLEETQAVGEDGRGWMPKKCIGCSITAHVDCNWGSSSKSVCGICRDSNKLLQLVFDNEMSAVHIRILDKIRASPFWLKPPNGDQNSPVPALTTPLHEAARTGRYEVLSMMLHHARGRGMLPSACLAADGNGRTAFDEATAAHETECARLLTTTFCDIPMPAPYLGWRRGQRSGKDISGGREGVHIPWVNEIDDEQFPSDTFTYINRVVEGIGASFNWRLCSDEGADKNPIPCRHQAADADDPSGGGFGAPAGIGGGGALGASIGTRGVGGGGGATGLAAPLTSCAFHHGGVAGHKGGCDSVKCGHVIRGAEHGRAYECNYRCPCAERLRVSNGRAADDSRRDCGLRASQGGVRAPLEVFKTATKGWGVRATQTIEQGTYICTYAGELIPEKTYTLREPEYDERDRREGPSGGGGACYCFNVFEDRRNPENNLVVDADRYRGVAALFNHTCCNANVEVRKLVANNADPRFPVHGFFARRKIEIKDNRMPELVFNYGTRETPNPCLCDSCEGVRRSRSEAHPRLR